MKSPDFSLIHFEIPFARILTPARRPLLNFLIFKSDLEVMQLAAGSSDL